MKQRDSTVAEVEARSVACLRTWGHVKHGGPTCSPAHFGRRRADHRLARFSARAYSPPRRGGRRARAR